MIMSNTTISGRDKNVVWHPYTPMKIWPEAIAIKSGKGSWLYDENGKAYLDAISSWWVNIHGHSHPHIAQRVSEQLNTLEHCIFAGFTHEPAVQLAEQLLGILPGNMSRIFYSDNGSTAVEVAIKMALQYWSNKGKARKRIIALEGAYHGDTFGAMAVSARSVFTAAFTDFLFDVTFIPFPAPGHEEHSLQVLADTLALGDTAAMIVEPLIQGSAGMYMYTPEVLNKYFELCRAHGALIIDDEVMTGFGRTGTLFAADQVTIQPDMMCLSKGITGGTMAMGVTAATEEIFQAFYDDDRSRMLYHGHSYTANPVSCAAALASMELLLHPSCTDARARITAAHAAFAASLAGHAAIADIRHTGTIIALELQTASAHYHSNLRDIIYRFFLDRGILMRPLGHIIYILPPYCITEQELDSVYAAIRTLLQLLQEGKLG